MLNELIGNEVDMAKQEIKRDYLRKFEDQRREIEELRNEINLIKQNYINFCKKTQDEDDNIKESIQKLSENMQNQINNQRQEETSAEHILN